MLVLGCSFQGASAEKVVVSDRDWGSGFGLRVQGLGFGV